MGLMGFMDLIGLIGLMSLMLAMETVIDSFDVIAFISPLRVDRSLDVFSHGCGEVEQVGCVGRVGQILTGLMGLIWLGDDDEAFDNHYTNHALSKMIYAAYIMRITHTYNARVIYNAVRRKTPNGKRI